MTRAQVIAELEELRAELEGCGAYYPIGIDLPPTLMFRWPGFDKVEVFWVPDTARWRVEVVTPGPGAQLRYGVDRSTIAECVAWLAREGE